MASHRKCEKCSTRPGSITFKGRRVCATCLSPGERREWIESISSRRNKKADKV